MGLIGLLAVWPFLVLLGAPFLALPTAGLFRMAALIARGDSVGLSDAFAYRTFLGSALLAGVVLTVMTTVSVVNMTVGISSHEPLGWGVATLAGWGLLFTWTVALCFWPVLLDPRRADLSLRERTRLAGLLVLAYPLRLAILTLIAALLVALSTVAFAALVSVTIAYVALLATRYVLPAADRLEGRATEPTLA